MPRIHIAIFGLLLLSVTAHGEVTADLKVEVVRHHAAIVRATYGDALKAARVIDPAVNLAGPLESGWILPLRQAPALASTRR
jgi:uncharacterized iron-regulated protein